MTREEAHNINTRSRKNTGKERKRIQRGFLLQEYDCKVEKLSFSLGFGNDRSVVCRIRSRVVKGYAMIVNSQKNHSLAG
jgi:hypothetical protein